MSLSPPLFGGLLGLGVVLLLALLASRSKQRAHQQRLDLIRQKIERRQAKLADEARRDAPANPPDKADDTHD